MPDDSQVYPVDAFIDPEGYRIYIDAAEVELRRIVSSVRARRRPQELRRLIATGTSRIFG